MNLMQDLRYGLRVLRKSPGFTFVAVLSLALGIGANSAIFSVVNAVLLRPLPYAHPDQLVSVGEQGTGSAITMPEYDFWKERAGSFASAAAYRGTATVHLAAGAKQDWITAMTISADFLRTLGIVPALGREFNADETRQGGPRALILTDGLWRRTFGADPAVLGRTVTLDDTSFVVVGVLPRSFWFPQAADSFVALRPSGSLDDRGFNTSMLARIRPGMSIRQAQSEMATVTDDIRRAHPELFKASYRGLSLLPYQDSLVGDTRMNLLLLFGAVGLLLLIACSNLASLLLARLAVRRKEIALRLALGSGRGRLLRQFLIENIVLTLAGGLAGLAAARALLASLVAAIPFSLPSAEPIRLDPPVLLFTLAIACATGLAFSVAPILTASRVDLQEALKSGGRSGGAVRQRARSVLVVAEVAISVTLLVSAGLLIQSLYRLHQERLGFTAEGLTTFNTPFATEHRRSAAEQWQYESTLLERFQSLPGVTSAAAVNVLPLTGHSNMPVQRDGHPDNSIGGMEIRYVTPSYFEAMGIPMRRGRGFENSDTASSPPVMVVNEAVVRQWWPGADPLGDRVVVGRFHGQDFGASAPRSVVGVVADTKSEFLKGPAKPTVFVPLTQSDNPRGGVAWVLRGHLPAGFAVELRRVVDQIDSRQRIGTIRTMDTIVSATTASSRFDAWLFAFLAGLALALTAVGVYGVLSFSVARRAGEIGTRMALGATPGAVLQLILRQGLVLIAVGLVLGLAGALAVTRSLSSLLYGVRANDPASFVGVSALLLGVGFLASYLPARRATRVDPMVALRDE
jgi:predicted permease